MEARTYDPDKRNTKRRTARESIRSLIYEEEDSLILGNSEIVPGIGNTVENIKLSPRVRK